MENKLINKAYVLLVEDVPIIQTVHARLLRKLNCEVDLAVNAEEALNLYQKNKYDLILLDLGLPDKNGIEVCQIIRQRNNEIPIIALTTNSFEIREQCLNAGMNYFIQKPTDEKTLKEILLHWISSY